jgi:endonuclease/exonuclease/phosphatase family metal-dependent hydrolase
MAEKHVLTVPDRAARKGSIAARIRRRLVVVGVIAMPFLAASLLTMPSAEAATLPESPASMRVATFNITGHATTRANYSLPPFSQALPGIAEGIRGHDVVALQEVASVDQLVTVARAAGYPYAEFTQPTLDPRPYAGPDVALLSRTPLSNVVRVELPKPGCVLGINCGGPVWAVAAQTSVGGVPVTVVNTHLSADFESNNRSAWRKAQADYIRTRWIDGNPQRVIVLGDFNGEESLHRGGPMTEAFATAQRATAPADPADPDHDPTTCSARVDEIYVRAPMDVTGYDGRYGGDQPGCGPRGLSDHARISAVLPLGTTITKPSTEDLWQSWTDATGPRTFDSLAPVDYNGSQWVFYRAPDGRVRATQTDGQRWWNDQQIPGGPPTTGAPTATVWQNRIHIFVRGQDGRIWGTAFAGTWQNWAAVPGSNTPEPPGTTVLNGTLFLVRVGLDRTVSVNRYTTDWQGWTSVSGLPVPAFSVPTAAAWRGNLHLFLRGSDNRVWGNAGNGTTWNGWAAVPGSYTQSAPAMETSDPSRLQLMVRGIDDRLYAESYRPGPGWSSWGVLPTARTFTAPSVIQSTVTWGRQILIAGPDGRTYRRFAPVLS